MNESNEFSKLKWVLIAFVVFVVSCLYTYREFKYGLVGQVADAKNTNIYEEKITGKWGRNRGSRLMMDYEFTDREGNRRKDSCRVPDDLEKVGVGAQGKLQVVYTGSKEGRSRLVGQSSVIWPLIFFGSLAGVVIFAIKMHKESKEH